MKSLCQPAMQGVCIHCVTDMDGPMALVPVRRYISRNGLAIQKFESIVIGVLVLHNADHVPLFCQSRSFKLGR